MTPKEAFNKIYSAICYNKKDRWSKNIKFIKKGKVRVADLEDLTFAKEYFRLIKQNLI